MAEYHGALYPYEGLLTKASFRVFELLPGTEHDAVSGKLRTVNWDDMPQYEAISYAWGNPNRKVPVLVDGKRIEVTLNLRTGLKHLRHRDHSRVLWVDAIWLVDRYFMRLVYSAYASRNDVNMHLVHGNISSCISAAPYLLRLTYLVVSIKEIFLNVACKSPRCERSIRMRRLSLSGLVQIQMTTKQESQLILS